MNPTCLDSLIEGYLDYQKTVRRLVHRSIVDMRCTFKRAVRVLEQLRPSVPLWKLTLEDYLVWLNQQREEGYSDKTATSGMTICHPLGSQHRRSFTLLTCPVTMERSFHLSFRTFQHKGHPHPVLSRSTPRNFPLGLSPKISQSTELETRLHPAL